MKIQYSEGTWFAVPLNQGGYAVGLVARANKGGILSYFFGPCRTSVPSLTEVEGLKPKAALRILRVGDLFLLRQKWLIIGKCASWNRSEWPMPVFIRRDPLRPKAWRVYYSDIDPNVVLREEPESIERNDLEEDGLFGAGAAELVLTKLLKCI